jgi:hypothetical protein
MGEMLRDLGESKTKHGTFDVVVAVGHSNMTGIAMTSDSALVSWAQFATFLKLTFDR